MRYTDLMNIKSEIERKSTIRKRICEVIHNALINEFGDDFVRFLPYDIYVGSGTELSKIPSNTVIADVGDIIAKDGFSRGALIQIETTVKNWNDTKTAKTDRPALTLEDIDEGIKIADELAKKKIEQKKVKEKNKLKQIEKDQQKRKKE